MKTIEVEITGTTPLLQHRFGEAAQAEQSTRRVQIAAKVPRDEAELVAYREKSGELYHPGAAISTLLCNAGSAHKQRGSRKSLRFIVPAAVRVTEDAIPLFATDTERATTFEVDARPVTIPATKGKVMRYRPRLDQWAARFTLVVNELLLPVDIVQQLLTEGGQQIGIGDFRPEKRGPFGTFRVTSFKELTAET